MSNDLPAKGEDRDQEQMARDLLDSLGIRNEWKQKWVLQEYGALLVLATEDDLRRLEASEPSHNPPGRFLDLLRRAKEGPRAGGMAPALNYVPTSPEKVRAYYVATYGPDADLAMEYDTLFTMMARGKLDRPCDEAQARLRWIDAELHKRAKQPKPPQRGKLQEDKS